MSAAYLTVVEVAVLARCEHKAVRRAISAGRLEAFRTAGKLLIREDCARAWIEARPAVTRPAAPRRRSARPAGKRAERAGSVARLEAIDGRRG